MPPLADSTLAPLRTALLARRRAVTEAVRAELAASGEAHFIDLAGRVRDAGDESIADLLADLDAARVDRQVGELREIESALARLDDGSYGECADCGAEIGLPRLQVQPAARRCVACQTRQEHDFAHPGTPRL